MGFLKKLFGSSQSDAPPRHAAQSRPPVQSNADEQSVFCDFCNRPASFATGTYFTANEFLLLLQKGLEPHESVFFVTEVSGISREALIAALPGQISLTFTTGWLLCPSCAPQATRLIAKPAGNLPGGEPGAMTRERTARDAGTGKMLTLARALATKAMTGGSVSTVQADYYIISIVPPAPNPADRDALFSRLLASAGYSKGSAQVQFAVATGGASSLPVFTDGLLRNYERAAPKEVDLGRSKMHDFGGNGVPQGNLVAVFHTERPNAQRAGR